MWRSRGVREASVTRDKCMRGCLYSVDSKQGEDGDREVQSGK